jgi:hypothetical protein
MKHLPVAGAFRAILRTTHPERADLQKIDSYRWFHDRQRGDNLIHDQADAPAYAALDLLKAGVKSQKFRLRGCLNGAVPDDIDPIDAREGRLDVFAGTLQIYESKSTYRTARIYTSVHCYADDLPLGEPEAARKSPQEIQDGPEVRRAKAVLKKLYGDRIPPAEQLTDGDLHKAVNQAREKDTREISKTTILRASGRRNDQQSK